MCMRPRIMSEQMTHRFLGYGHVYLVQKVNGKDINEYYALKEIDASAAEGESLTSIQKRETGIKNERNVM